MDIKRGLKNVFNSVAGNLPVIGPHADIEIDLMLAGKKPFTCLLPWPEQIPPPSSEDPMWTNIYKNDPEFFKKKCKEHAELMKMDEAVRQGRLKSFDVIKPIITEPGVERPPGAPTTYTTRWYSQQDKEKEMLQFIAAEDHYRKTGDGSLYKKEIGEYYGYRKRDQWLWNTAYNTIFSDNKVAKQVSRFVYFINRNITQPAYQGKILHQIEKEQKRTEKKNHKKDKGPSKPKA